MQACEPPPASTTSPTDCDDTRADVNPDAQEVCGAIRVRLAELYSQEVADVVRVLYGGSVNPGNIKSLMAKRHIDGALVGGASLDPDKFAAVVRYWI